MSTHRVTVGRVRNVYLVPREHRAPDEVRAKLDRVARDALPAALRRALFPAIEHDDERVWLIRRLDLGLGLNPGADDAPLAQSWGTRLAAALASVLAAGPDDGNVVVFPSRDAFLARYLTDRATGRAGGRWWYAEFDSLAALPPGSAIREALVRDPARAAAVFRHLAMERSVESVLGVLAPQDARVVWRLLTPAGEPAPVSAAVIASLLAAWPRAAIRPVGGYASHSNAIRWFVAVPPGSATTEELRSGVELLLAAADAVGAPDTAEAFSRHPLTSGHREALRGLLVSGDRLGHRSSGGEPRAIVSPFAGLFLAWAAFSSSGLAAFCQHGAFRYLVALKLVGRSRVVEAWQDSAVLLAAGLDRPPAAQDWDDFAASGERTELAQDLVRWFVRREGTVPPHPAEPDLAHFTLAGCGLPPGLDPETDLLGTLAARAALRAFAARLPGFGATSADHLYRNFLSAPGDIRISGSEVVVRLDPPPLHVVLRLGGLGDEGFTLPDGRRARVTLNPD